MKHLDHPNKITNTDELSDSIIALKEYVNKDQVQGHTAWTIQSESTSIDELSGSFKSRVQATNLKGPPAFSSGHRQIGLAFALLLKAVEKSLQLR